LSYLAGGSDFFAVIAGEARADIRKHWTPTAESFFSRVLASLLVDLLCENRECDARDDRVTGFAKLKKAEKTDKIEKRVSDPTTQKLMRLTPDQKIQTRHRGARLHLMVPSWEPQLAPQRAGFFCPAITRGLGPSKLSDGRAKG